MSKYRILDMPNSQPGKCANCGASKVDGRKYIDFGLEVEWYGTVHICSLCLIDIAGAAGLFEELENKLLQIELANSAYEELRDQGVELHGTVVQTFKEFEEYYARLHSLRVADNPDSDSNLDSVETESNNSSISESESGTTQSNSSTRRTDIPSLADLLKD